MECHWTEIPVSSRTAGPWEGGGGSPCFRKLQYTPKLSPAVLSDSLCSGESQVFPETTYFNSFQYSSERARKGTSFPKTTYQFAWMKIKLAGVWTSPGPEHLKIKTESKSWLLILTWLTHSTCGSEIWSWYTTLSGKRGGISISDFWFWFHSYLRDYGAKITLKTLHSGDGQDIPSRLWVSLWEENSSIPQALSSGAQVTVFAVGSNR